METQKSAFFKGARDITPLVIGAIPAGIVFGTLSSNAGFPVAGTVGMSLLVSNGPSQFVAIGLVAAGTSWPMIVLTTLVVNLRLLLFAATLMPYLQRLPRCWQVLLSIGLTDPVFLVSVDRWRQRADIGCTHWYQLGAMLFIYIVWDICTLVGSGAGQMLKGISGWGLDFIMLAAFIGMILSYLKDSPNCCATLVAGAASLAFHGLPHQLGLILAAILGAGSGAAAAARRPSRQSTIVKESGR